MLFPVILHLFTGNNFIAGRINRHQFAVRIRGVQTFRLRIQRQAGAVGARIGNGFFQLQRGAIHDPNHALFTDTGDVNRVARVICHQLARLQRFDGFAALTPVQHQPPFYVTRFCINRGYRAVDRIAKPQRLSRLVKGGAKGFQIAMDCLRHVQRDRIKTVDNPALVGFTALRGCHPQRILLLAHGHFIRPFAHRFTQYLFGGMHLERPGKQ